MMYGAMRPIQGACRSQSESKSIRRRIAQTGRSDQKGNPVKKCGSDDKKKKGGKKMPPLKDFAMVVKKPKKDGTY